MSEQTNPNGREVPVAHEMGTAEAGPTHIVIPLAMRDDMVQQLSQFPYGQVSGIINALVVAPLFCPRAKPAVKPAVKRPVAPAVPSKKPRKRRR